MFHETDPMSNKLSFVHQSSGSILSVLKSTFGGCFAPLTNAHDLYHITKEELRKFNGSPLSPERRAYTVQYKLSELEAKLYAAVTE
jgi:hypothetical protein